MDNINESIIKNNMNIENGGSFVNEAVVLMCKYLYVQNTDGSTAERVMNHVVKKINEFPDRILLTRKAISKLCAAEKSDYMKMFYNFLLSSYIKEVEEPMKQILLKNVKDLPEKALYAFPYVDKLTSGKDEAFNFLSIAKFCNTHKGSEILMNADCSAGKTFAVERYLFPYLELLGWNNILASPNIAQVIQNNNKYGVKAIVGNNHMVCPEYNFSSVCSIFDKLLFYVNNLPYAELSKTCLVIDEAHQLIDAESYRFHAINQVKEVCRKITAAGGVVIYMTASDRHIEKMPPDSISGNRKYDAVFKFVRVSGTDPVYYNGVLTQYPFYTPESSVLADQKNNVDIVNNNRFNKAKIVEFNNIMSFPGKLIEEVKSGKYILMQNNNKEMNRRIVNYLNSKGIPAACIASDDTNFSDMAYSNDVYDSIVRFGKIPFGNVPGTYKVICTTCLLNNGTSIDDITECDDMIKRNTECIFVCKNSDDLMIEQIDQFFSRIRYYHAQNMIFIQNIEYDEKKDFIPYDKYFDICMSNAENELKKILCLPAISSSKARKRYAGFRNDFRISPMIEINPTSFPYINANMVSVAADEMYGKELFYNHDYLAAEMEERYGEIPVIFDKYDKVLDLYELQKFTDEKASEFINAAKEICSDKTVMEQFCNGDVDQKNGKNNEREILLSIDPILPDFFANVILYMSAGNPENITDENLNRFFAEFCVIAKKCDGNILQMKKDIKDIENQYFNIFFSHAKNNRMVRKAVNSYIISENMYGSVSDDTSISRNITKNIFREIFINASGPISKEDQAYGNFVAKYYDLIFSQRKTKEWIRLYQYTLSGKCCGISWAHLCDIGTCYTTNNIADLIKYAENVALSNSANTSFNTSTVFGMEHKMLLSTECFNAMGLNQNNNVKNSASEYSKWFGKTIGYKECSLAMEFLKSQMLEKNNYYYRELPSVFRLRIFRFFAEVFGYTKGSEKVVINRSGKGNVSHNIVTEMSAITLRNVRKSIQNDEPIFLTFKADNSCNKAIFQDVFEFANRLIYSGLAYNDANNIMVIASGATDDSLADHRLDNCYSVIIKDGKPIAYYKSDMSGNALSDNTDADGNVKFGLAKGYTVAMIRNLIYSHEVSVIQVENKNLKTVLRNYRKILAVM